MKPRFPALRSKRTPVTAASASAIGSGDASSTTMTSQDAASVFASTLARHVNVRSGLPYTGITIDARGASTVGNASGATASACA